MRGQFYPSNNAPFTRKELEKVTGKGPLYDLLDTLCVASNVTFFDDFLGDTINLDNFLLTADGTATDFAVTAAANGVVAGTTGATGDAGHSIQGPVIWKGDLNCWMLASLKVDVVTAFEVEVGFTTALSDKTLSAVNDVDTPTVRAGGTDLAVFHLSTDQTLATAAFVTEGSTASMVPTKTALATYTPTAATYFQVLVRLVGDKASCWVFENNGTVLKARANHGDTIASRVEGGTLMAPWLFIFTLDTTPKVCTVDYIMVGQDRE